MKQANIKLIILPVLLLLCTIFYYFGELINWAAWEALRREFFYGIHDIHRLLFLAPIIYAGYRARVKGAIIITLVSLVIFLPRAFFISPFPDPILRTLLFTIIAGVIGILTGIIRNKSEQCSKLETAAERERDTLLNVVSGIADGVIIINPEYKVRYTNPAIERDFGDGVGHNCFKYLYNLDRPCEKCKLSSVLAGNVEEQQYAIANNRTYNVLAIPYTDKYGAPCQLGIFKYIEQ